MTTMKKIYAVIILAAAALIPSAAQAQQSRTQNIINAALKGSNIELRAD